MRFNDITTLADFDIDISDAENDVNKRLFSPRVAKLVNAVALGATGGNAFRVRIPARGPELLYADWLAKGQTFARSSLQSYACPL